MRTVSHSVGIRHRSRDRVDYRKKVTVLECLRFVHLGLQSVLVLLEQA